MGGVQLLNGLSESQATRNSAARGPGGRGGGAEVGHAGAGGEPATVGGKAPCRWGVHALKDHTGDKSKRIRLCGGRGEGLGGGLLQAYRLEVQLQFDLLEGRNSGFSGVGSTQGSLGAIETGRKGGAAGLGSAAAAPAGGGGGGYTLISFFTLFMLAFMQVGKGGNKWYWGRTRAKQRVESRSSGGAVVGMQKAGFPRKSS